MPTDTLEIRQQINKYISLPMCVDGYGNMSPKKLPRQKHEYIQHECIICKIKAILKVPVSTKTCPPFPLQVLCIYITATVTHVPNIRLLLPPTQHTILHATTPSSHRLLTFHHPHVNQTTELTGSFPHQHWSFPSGFQMFKRHVDQTTNRTN